MYVPRLRILLDPVLDAKFHNSYDVDDNGCWVWHRAVSGKRYGAFCIGNHHQRSAHKFSLEKKLGRFIRKGMQALHTCDNSLCVNPDHLYEGTQLQNMHDKHTRGRHPTRYKTRMLTDKQVKRIRQLRYLVSEHEVARRFGISRSVVAGINQGHKYKDVV